MSLGLKDRFDVTPIHVDVNIVSADVLDVEAFKKWRPEYADARFLFEGSDKTLGQATAAPADGEKYVCGWAIEKMSKSMFNVVNPDLIVERYGADTLRLYEMFLGPINMSKPWDSNGIDGCSRFLRKLWNLYWGRDDKFRVDESEPTTAELKVLHRLIRKVSDDIEVYSYNTSISAFMIAVGELAKMKTASRRILEPIVQLIAPFTPHIAEELWHQLGHDTTVCDAPWPEVDEQYLKEDTATLSISFNGKTRFTLDFPTDASKEDIEKSAFASEPAQKYLAGMQVCKVIVVPGRIVNIVVKPAK